MSAPLPRLQVDPSGRYLQTESGSPFFYLGDTAWQLFHRLTLDEAEFYLKDRKAKGFSVVQAVALAELGGLDLPNALGDLALEGRDPARPNERYFRHVDAILEAAERNGLYVALLPTWGSYWKTGNPNRIFDAESARAFGLFLGRRYSSRSLIWVLGGDANVDNDQERAVIVAMAEGLREGDGGRNLITFHPRGPGRSSDYFHGEPWLDFNMIQSSHAARDHDNGLFVGHDLTLTPPKPTLDGEPRYEGLMVGFYWNGAHPAVRFDDYDVRQAAYWAVIAGACGHTYGHSSVWQMYTHDRQGVLGANVPWQEALDHPGAFQMGHVRRLFEAFPFNELKPDPSFVLSGPAGWGSKVRAAVARDGSFAVVYSPRGEPFTVDRGRLALTRIRESWFDPRYGTSFTIHSGDTTAIQTYTPPSTGRGFDWVLILDDGAAPRTLPGGGK